LSDGEATLAITIDGNKVSSVEIDQGNVWLNVYYKDYNEDSMMEIIPKHLLHPTWAKSYGVRLEVNIDCGKPWYSSEEEYYYQKVTVII
jgi:hypothetical protein